MNITVRCTTCYPMRLGDCPDTLYFAIAVAANTEYAYELCDSQGNIYEGETTTNGSGNVSISTSDVPFDAYPGLFNKWAGSFKLTLYDADGDAVPFTVAGTEYTCIAFSFRETVELDNCNNEISCGCLTGGYAFPSDLIGQDGDFYIVETTGVILEKVDGAWTVFFVPTSGILTGANNGLHLDGTNVQLGVNPLIENTTISAGAFNYKVTSVPEANKTAEYEASQDLFGLLALVGNAINGQGNRYVLTYDGNGDPQSWLFQKVSNDSSVGGTYNSTIGYISLLSNIECYVEVTSSGLRLVTSDGTNLTGLTVTQATEVMEAIVNGVTKMTIDSSGVTVNNLTSAGDRLVFANLNGLLGIKTSAQATAMLDNMVGDGGAGGTKGLVPAPAAGDAAANKFLKADGTWAAASGGGGVLINSWTIDTPASAVGIGYTNANYIILGTITIPANTMQAGDYLEVKAVTGTLAGSGNHVVEAWFTSVVNPAPDPSIYATGRFGSLGSFGTTSPRLYGFNFPIYMKAAGGFLMPSGRAIPFSASANEGDAFNSFQGSYGGTRTDASSNAGAINYTVDNYIHIAFIAANTITVYLQGATVEHYRP